MKGLVEDRSMKNAQSDRFWDHVNRTMENMIRAGWNPNSEEFDKRLKEIVYSKFPERRPPEKQQQQPSYNPVPSREPTSMRIQDYGYM